MLVDSRKLNKAAIDTEVCIVGAGPAGITLAREFIGSGIRVALLESGGVYFNAETDALSQGEVIGDPFSPLHKMRRRQFGGLANAWNIEIHNRKVGVRHTPLDPIDFEKRGWVPYSGWPISYSSLRPFFERAQSICKLGEFDYEPARWEGDTGKKVHFDGKNVTTKMFQFGISSAFTEEYRHELEKAANITIYLNANVVDIEADENGQTIQRVQVACLSGTKFQVDAKVFILATGGIENARLMLISNKVHRHGLGNHFDLVGRYFMDHPLVNCGLLTPYDKTVFTRMALYDKRFVNNQTVMGKFVLTEAVMRKEKLFNMSAMLFPREETYKSTGKISARNLLKGLREGNLPPDSMQQLKKFILHVDEVAIDFYKLKVKKETIYPSLRYGGWAEHKGIEKTYSKFEVISQTEETPNPRNRVTLSNYLDSLGVPQAKLIHRWSQTDIENVRRSQKVFADEFARAGLGQMQFEWEDGRPIAIPSSHHHIGTTRMHESAKEGVVDANCKVHGLSNLFVAGSSVFPTGGYANPTLTLIALAVRLADHLKASFSNS